MDETKNANGHEASASDPASVDIIPASGIGEKPSGQCAAHEKKPKCKDAGHFHAVRHGLLSRHPLQALCQLGENPKKLRRLEKQLRAALKPDGVVGELVFDKFWSSHLRCLLAVRIEAMVVAPLSQPVDRPTDVPSLLERETPTLLYSQAHDHRFPSEDRFASILEGLCLIQRYDAHVRKEEFRALALLLVSLSDGKEGLARAVAHMLGINREGGES